MSRSGYSEDCENNWDLICYRGAVKSAFRGARGQAFLREMLAALEALPEKKLIAHELEQNGAVCAIGAVGKKRGVEMGTLDPEDPETIAGVFGIATSMAREIVWENDDIWGNETPEARYQRMKRWVESEIKAA